MRLAKTFMHRIRYAYIVIEDYSYAIIDQQRNPLLDSNRKRRKNHNQLLNYSTRASRLLITGFLMSLTSFHRFLRLEYILILNSSSQTSFGLFSPEGGQRLDKRLTWP